MIPYTELNPAAAGTLMEYLREEITRALNDRRPLEEKWLRYQQLYKAVPESEVREFPFYGAANVVLPVVATDVDTIYSRLMGILFGPENLWSCRPLRPDAVQYAPRVQEFLKWAQEAELGAYPAVADFVMEMCKLGTGVLKERYRREQKLVYEFRESDGGNLAQFRRILTKDSPALGHVSLYDYLVPTGTIDHQLAPWNGERIMLNWSQLQERQRWGVYQASERLAAWNARDRGSWVRQEIERMGDVNPSLATQFELWEVWTEFDVRGIGEPVPVVCTVHLPTMTYLRIDYNPFFHQEKPFSVARYLRQEKQFYGIGLAEMLESFQDEGTTMHRQRLDNATIANSVMMKARKGIGIKEDEPIFPGRWFLVDQMDDVESMNMGQKYDSTVQNETLTMGYAQRRTGVNDYVMGNSTPAVGYATANTNILQHQEAAKRFDQTLREVRRALRDSGRRILELYQQFNQNGKEFMVLGDEDGAVVHQVLQFPLELIRHSVAIDVTATSASLNKEVEIRTNSLLMQQVTQQFYPQLLQAMQLIINPTLPLEIRMIAYQMVVGGSTLMRRVLDSYDVQDLDTIIPKIEEILSVAQQLGAQSPLGNPGLPGTPGAPVGQPGGGFPPGAGAPPGMAALPAGVG